MCVVGWELTQSLFLVSCQDLGDPDSRPGALWGVFVFLEKIRIFNIFDQWLCSQCQWLRFLYQCNIAQRKFSLLVQYISTFSGFHIWKSSPLFHSFSLIVDSIYRLFIHDLLIYVSYYCDNVNIPIMGQLMIYLIWSSMILYSKMTNLSIVVKYYNRKTLLWNTLADSKFIHVHNIQP